MTKPQRTRTACNCRNGGPHRNGFASFGSERRIRKTDSAFLQDYQGSPSPWPRSVGFRQIQPDRKARLRSPRRPRFGRRRANGKVIGQIGNLPGITHGIAISPETHQGFATEGRPGLAAAFDLKTLKQTTTITAAPDADGILYEPTTKHIYVVNGDSGSLSVIDPSSDLNIATINVGSKLEPAVADGKGHIYVNGEEKNEIIAIDAKTNNGHRALGNADLPDAAWHCHRPCDKEVVFELCQQGSRRSEPRYWRDGCHASNRSS